MDGLTCLLIIRNELFKGRNTIFEFLLVYGIFVDPPRNKRSREDYEPAIALAPYALNVAVNAGLEREDTKDWTTLQALLCALPNTLPRRLIALLRGDYGVTYFFPEA